jgi:hypothetical protein
MNCTAVSKSSAAASAVTAKPHVLHSNVCTSGNPMGREIDRANRMGFPQLRQHSLDGSAFMFTYACNNPRQLHNGRGIIKRLTRQQSGSFASLAGIRRARPGFADEMRKEHRRHVLG